MPFDALGNRHDATTMMSSNINKVGIIILEAFSMPPLTPWMMTKWVANMMANNQNNG